MFIKYLNPFLWLSLLVRLPLYFLYLFNPFAKSIPLFPPKHWTKKKWVCFRINNTGMWVSEKDFKKEIIRVFGPRLERLRLEIDGQELLLKKYDPDTPFKKLLKPVLLRIISPYILYCTDEDTYKKYFSKSRDASDMCYFKGFDVELFDDDYSGDYHPDNVIKRHLYSRLNAIGISRDYQKCVECDHNHTDDDDWEFLDGCYECGTRSELPAKITKDLGKFHKFVLSSEANYSIEILKENKKRGGD